MNKGFALLSPEDLRPKERPNGVCRPASRSLLDLLHHHIASPSLNVRVDIVATFLLLLLQFTAMPA